MTGPILIFGRGGQVGQALIAACEREGLAYHALTSAEADITSLSTLTSLAAEFPESPVINAAAYTAVDKAETDAEKAYAVNATAPAYLASLFGQDRPVLHYSTDYVFPGDGTSPYQPQDPTAPLGVYGLSKRVGEQAILSSTHGTVLRTAWVYGAHGANFLKTMIRVGRERGALRVVADQRGTPTHAQTIADATIVFLKAQMAGDPAAAPGVYHLTAKGEASWYDFAAEIFKHLKDQADIDVGLDAISTADYPTPAKRPSYSVLDCSALDQIDGLHRPQWEEPVAETVAAVLAQD